MTTPKIDRLQKAYYNAAEDRYQTTTPLENFEDWEPVLLFGTGEGSEMVALTADKAGWLLPDIANLISNYTRWLERQIKESN